MILKDLTTGRIIATDLKICKNFFDNLFGLLRKSNHHALLFNSRFGIHTFGLKESIDIIILDKNFKVVKIKQSLKPNYFFFWNPKYDLVLELPAGLVKKTNIYVFDQFKLI